MYQIILCSCPDMSSASIIAERLVKHQCAACVQIMPGITSIYRWQDNLESAQEHLLLIKSHCDLYQIIETEIKQLHPYELPEIIAVPVERGLPEYLQWIDTCLSTK